MKKRFTILFSLLLLLVLPVSARQNASLLNDQCDMRIYGEHAATLLDGNLRSHSKLHSGTELTIRSSELIGGVYLEFSHHPGSWTLLCGERTIPCGEEGFLHEYISNLNTYSLTLRFHGEGILANVYVLSLGEKPSWVQCWESQPPAVDVLLLPTHSDDDTLFFGGVVPWCLDKGARVQVAYLISHNDEPFRRNEILNALWACGLRSYPVLGEYEDLGVSTASHRNLYADKGIPYEEMLQRTLRLYRRYKPQVVICHDKDGEYGHGAHKLYYQLAVDAMAVAGDSAIDKESAALWGVWEPQKLYSHLSTENPIIIDLDEPLRSFHYKTGYELTQEAFACHESQYDFFAWYFWGAPTAEQLQQYSAREYGLIFSSVGADKQGNSFFENITLYSAMPQEPEPTPEAEVTPLPEAEEETPAPTPEPSHIAISRLGEIYAEQRKLITAICALSAFVGVLLALLIHNHKKRKRATP